MKLIYTDLVITNDEIWIVGLWWYATALLLYNLKEVWMVHGFTRCKSFLMIITEQFVQEIQSFLRNQVLVFTMNKALPSFTGMSS